MKVDSFQSCPTLWDSTDYAVRGILQARILEWVAFSFSRGSSQPRIEPRFPALQVDSSLAEPQGKPFHFHFYIKQITNTEERITLELVKGCFNAAEVTQQIWLFVCYLTLICTTNVYYALALWKACEITFILTTAANKVIYKQLGESVISICF